MHWQPVGAVEGQCLAELVVDVAGGGAATEDVGGHVRGFARVAFGLCCWRELLEWDGRYSELVRGLKDEEIDIHTCQFVLECMFRSRTRHTCRLLVHSVITPKPHALRSGTNRSLGVEPSFALLARNLQTPGINGPIFLGMNLDAVLLVHEAGIVH